MANTRQSRPDSGLGFQAKVLKTLQVGAEYGPVNHGLDRAASNDFIRTSIYDQHSGSMKITTRPDSSSH